MIRPITVKSAAPIEGVALYASLSVEEFDDLIFAYATLFTAIRVVAPGVRERAEFQHFPEAALAAFHDPRVMVYAVTASGQSRMLPRSQWGHFLQMWREANGIGGEQSPPKSKRARPKSRRL